MPAGLFLFRNSSRRWSAVGLAPTTGKAALEWVSDFEGDDPGWASRLDSHAHARRRSGGKGTHKTVSQNAVFLDPRKREDGWANPLADDLSEGSLLGARRIESRRDRAAVS